MTTFAIVGLPEPHTLTADRDTVIAAFLILTTDAIHGSPALKLIDASGGAVVPILTAPTRLTWFRDATGIHLNQFLRAHKPEIVAALQSIVPPIEQVSRLARMLQTTEVTHV